MLQEMGMESLAQVFRDLVAMSDRKIELFKQLNAAGQTPDVIKQKIERNNPSRRLYDAEVGRVETMCRVETFLRSVKKAAR